MKKSSAKTFAPWGRYSRQRPQGAKVFWFFFSKKNILPLESL
jgi:hypothetical protein